MHDSVDNEISSLNEQLNYTNNLGFIYMGGCMMGWKYVAH